MFVPVDGPVTSPFGMRWGRLHARLDIGAPCGRPVRAATGGELEMAGPNGGYGNYVLVQQSTSIATGYAHLQSISTRVGAPVTRGQMIGAVGKHRELVWLPSSLRGQARRDAVRSRSVPVKAELIQLAASDGL